MKRVRWITALFLILAMFAFGGCSDRGDLNDGTLNDGMTNNGTVNDGTMNDRSRSTEYDDNFNAGGFIDDVTDDVKEGVDNVRDKMHTVENDTKTNLGRMAEEPQLNR